MSFFGTTSPVVELDPTALKIASNLSDLASAATARTNLGVSASSDVLLRDGSQAATGNLDLAQFNLENIGDLNGGGGTMNIDPGGGNLNINRNSVVALRFLSSERIQVYPFETPGIACVDVQNHTIENLGLLKFDDGVTTTPFKIFPANSDQAVVQSEAAGKFDFSVYSQNHDGTENTNIQVYGAASVGPGTDGNDHALDIGWKPGPAAYRISTFAVGTETKRYIEYLDSAFAEFEDRGAAPSNPPAGCVRVYIRSGSLYRLDSAGTETLIG